MSIKEAIGRLKVVDNDTPQPLSGGISIDGSSISIKSSGRSVVATGRKWSLLPQRVAASAASRARRAEMHRPEREDLLRVMPVEAPRAAQPAGTSRHETTRATTIAGLVTGPRTAHSSDAAKLSCTGGGGGGGSTYGTRKH